jgi:hypothetical protein
MLVLQPFLVALVASLSVVAAPLQRRTGGVKLMLLSKPGNDQWTDALLNQGDIRIVGQVGPEALEAIEETIAVLQQPGFENTGLFHTFLDRESDDLCFLNAEALPADRVSWLLDATKPEMLGVFHRLEEVLKGSFPITEAQEISEPSADGTHTTVMRGDEKGTAKARSARTMFEPAKVPADRSSAAPRILAAKTLMATRAT